MDILGTQHLSTRYTCKHLEYSLIPFIFVQYQTMQLSPVFLACKKLVDQFINSTLLERPNTPYVLIEWRRISLII